MDGRRSFDLHQAAILIVIGLVYPAPRPQGGAHKGPGLTPECAQIWYWLLVLRRSSLATQCVSMPRKTISGLDIDEYAQRAVKPRSNLVRRPKGRSSQGASTQELTVTLSFFVELTHPMLVLVLTSWLHYEPMHRKVARCRQMHVNRLRPFVPFRVSSLLFKLASSHLIQPIAECLDDFVFAVHQILRRGIVSLMHITGKS